MSGKRGSDETYPIHGRLPPAGCAGTVSAAGARRLTSGGKCDRV